MTFLVFTMLNNFNKCYKLMQKDAIYITLSAVTDGINVIVTMIVLNYHIFEWGKLSTHGKKPWFLQLMRLTKPALYVYLSTISSNFKEIRICRFRNDES